MTRAEAKNILLNAAWLGSNTDRERIEEAVNMAIKALEEHEVDEAVCFYVKAYIVEVLREISKSLAIIAEAFKDDEEGDFIEDGHDN